MGANYLYKASEVSYTPENSEFEVDNVEDAINELYNKKVENIWNIEMGYLYIFRIQVENFFNCRN